MYSKISTYNEAVEIIKKIGFMPLSKNPFGFISFEDITFEENWHTGTEKDPWLWKDKVAYEKIASYSRVIGKRLAFISIEWYPYFLAMYRPSITVEERYEDGLIGNMSLQIYHCIKDDKPLNTHELKKRLGINKENKSKFENGLIELQGSMDITVFGASKRINKQGEYYGWLVSEYTTVEQWASPELLHISSKLSKHEAVKEITSKIREVSPSITEKDIYKFLGLKQ